MSGQHLQELESKKDLKAFFESCQQQCQGRTKTWDLSSFLIKPVQRVLKYPLLINVWVISLSVVFCGEISWMCHD